MMATTPRWLIHTLLTRSFNSLEHFASKLTLLINTLYSLTHFTPQHILLLSTVCTSAHLGPQHTLLPGTICSLEDFATWNTLLHGTLYFLEHFSKVSWEESPGAMYSRDLSVPAKEQRVPENKVCCEEKCSREPHHLELQE